MSAYLSEDNSEMLKIDETTLKIDDTTLKTQGVQVFQGVIPLDVCERTVAEIDAWLETACGVDMTAARESVLQNSSTIANWPNHLRGIIKNYGVGHLQAVWDVRQHERLASLCGQLYGVESRDLLTSMDAVCVMYPYNDRSIKGMMQKDNIRTAMSEHRPVKWHIDQGKPVTTEDEVVYQGFIALRDMRADHGTFGYIKGSMQYHNDLLKMDPKTWRLSQEQYDWLTQQDSGDGTLCKEVALDIPAGSYVCWDSRVVHCALPHSLHVPQSERMWRYNVYVCMEPRSRCPRQVMLKRFKAFEEGRTTDHQPSKCVLQEKNPRTYGKEVRPIPHITEYQGLPSLTLLGRRLLGYEQ